jgi:hypothetical protein
MYPPLVAQFIHNLLLQNGTNAMYDQGGDMPAKPQNKHKRGKVAGPEQLPAEITVLVIALDPAGSALAALRVVYP